MLRALAHLGDWLPDMDFIALLHQQLAVVTIGAQVVVVMLDDDKQSIALESAAAVNNLASGSRAYRLSRRAVLQGVDGIVFVADSHPAREQANVDALADALGHLEAIGLTPEQRARLPWVFQYNKRDLPYAVAVERLRPALNPGGAPDFESVAREGRGVSETLRAACKQVLAKLTGEIAASRPGAAVVSSAMAPGMETPAAPVMPPAAAHAPAAAVRAPALPASRPAPFAPPASAVPAPRPLSVVPRVESAPARPGESPVARPFLVKPRIQTAPRRPWRGPGGGARA